MMRPTFAAVAALATLGGCAAMGVTPRPDAVSLTQSALVVTLTDGTRCTMTRPADASAWSGRLQNCAIDWPYRVALDDRSNILRQLVEAIFVQQGDKPLLNALGTVEITDPRSGTVLSFVSPPPVRED